MSDKCKWLLENLRLHLLKGEIIQAFDKIEEALIEIEKQGKERDDFHTVKRKRNLEASEQ